MNGANNNNVTTFDRDKGFGLLLQGREEAAEDRPPSNYVRKIWLKSNFANVGNE
jgi:hypothetical protein